MSIHNNDEIPDISRLKLHSKANNSPLLATDSAQKKLIDSTPTMTRNHSSSSTSSSSNSSIDSQNNGHYHGLPNISADLQARVLAFQEKRQAAQALKGNEDKTDLKKAATSPADIFTLKSLNSANSHGAHDLPPPLPPKNSTTATSLASKRISPPMRLPPSLPPLQQQQQRPLPQSVSMSLPGLPLAKASPQAAARLPRSRPSLSQRRGMKLNVNDITNNDQEETTSASTAQQKPRKLNSAKMITSSSTLQIDKLDTKKKPVAELIGERGQLANPQELPKLQGLFANYSKYVDIKSGSLNFNGKASLHSNGVDFSGGSSFRISIDELEFVEELGRGNYGTVSKVLHKPTKIIMAMKEVRLELDDSKFRQILMELEILHNCDSEYIVDFYGAFFVEGAVYMCIEYMNLGSLDKVYKGGFPEPQLAFVAKCVIKGLKQLKDEQNIIHRDVKPTNILVNDKGKIKLCDFGVSGNLVASMARTNIGCQSYMAPERIKSANPDDVSYSVQSDIWSLGLSLLEVALGKYPLISENIFAQLKQIVEDEPPQLPETFSLEARDFVSLCLEKESTKRPTYLELLKHPWILKYDDDLKSENDLKNFLNNRVK